jgi:hypothetical protein
LSCSSDSSDSSGSGGSGGSPSSGTYKWSFKLDGVLYQWQGTLQNPNDGGGNYAAINNKGVLNLTANNDLAVTVQFPNILPGPFTFNSSNPSTEGFSLIIINSNFTSDSYLTSLGGTMNVNITSLPSNTLSTNPTNPGKVIGTFSGTIKKGGSQSIYSITEGKFEVLRVQ